MNTDLPQVDTIDTDEVGNIIADRMDITEQTAETLFKSFTQDEDNINISNLYTPQKPIDLSDLFVSTDKTPDALPILDYDDVMNSINDDLKDIVQNAF
jgi:hypothetical protein